MDALPAADAALVVGGGNRPWPGGLAFGCAAHSGVVAAQQSADRWGGDGAVGGAAAALAATAGADPGQPAAGRFAGGRGSTQRGTAVAAVVCGLPPIAAGSGATAGLPGGVAASGGLRGGGERPPSG